MTEPKKRAPRKRTAATAVSEPVACLIATSRDGAVVFDPSEPRNTCVNPDAIVGNVVVECIETNRTMTCDDVRLAG